MNEGVEEGGQERARCGVGEGTRTVGRQPRGVKEKRAGRRLGRPPSAAPLRPPPPSLPRAPRCHPKAASQRVLGGGGGRRQVQPHTTGDGRGTRVLAPQSGSSTDACHCARARSPRPRTVLRAKALDTIVPSPRQKKTGRRPRGVQRGERAVGRPGMTGPTRVFPQTFSAPLLPPPNSLCVAAGASVCVSSAMAAIF